MTGFAEDHAPYAAPMTKAEFLRWVQGQQGRFELKGGRVVMQAGGTRRHSWIAGRFIAAFSARLDPAFWAVGTTDSAVEIGEDIRYPDVVIERLQGDATLLSTDRPVVLVEVLSPSSDDLDKIEKLAEYTSLPSILCYIVAAQDAPECWIWRRRSEGAAFPAKPTVIKGRDQSIEIAALSISIPLEEIYRSIIPDPSSPV